MRIVRRFIAQMVGWSVLATLISAVVVTFRHILNTPQQLTSLLAGESLLYRWKRQQVFYKVLGKADAQPLVLLHAPAIGASAYEMHQIFESLARTYRVYAPDLPGFGLSDRPTVEYTADLYTTFVGDFLMDVVRRPAMLVASGESCNYAIAAAGTSSTSALCQSLVLISPFALYGRDRDRALWSALATFLTTPPVEAMLYALLSTRAAFTLMQASQHPLIHTMDFAYFYAITHQLGAQHAPMALLAGKLVQDSSKQFENVRQPTLILWGVRALNNARYLAGQKSNEAHIHKHTQIELMQNAGRYAHEERPEAVVSIIEQWATGDETPAEDKASKERQAQTKEEMKSADKDRHERVTAVQEAYCMKCKKKTQVQNAHEITMKNGRPAVRGTCAVCGSTIQRTGRLGQDK